MPSDLNIEVLSLTLGYAPEIALHWSGFLYKSLSLKAKCIASSSFGLERSLLCQDSNKLGLMGIETVYDNKERIGFKKHFN